MVPQMRLPFKMGRVIMLLPESATLFAVGYSERNPADWHAGVTYFTFSTTSISMGMLEGTSSRPS